MTPLRDHSDTATFLHHEFGAAKFADARYLSWYYDESPEGAAVCGNRDDEHGRLATYALVPQWWRRDGERARLGITVDACVRAGAQRSGVFTDLAGEVFANAEHEGVAGTLTIANANSTPAFVNKLGFDALAPLPVRVTTTLGPTGTSRLVAPDTDALDALAADYATVPANGWIHDWTSAALQWRLANPSREYALHRNDDVWCLSTRDSVAGLGVAVVLALVPRGGRAGVDPRPVINAAGRHHRARLALHAGRNAAVEIPGFTVPRRLLPSPLNLLTRGFGSRTNASLAAVATYEFIDTDHY